MAPSAFSFSISSMLFLPTPPPAEAAGLAAADPNDPSDDAQRSSNPPPDALAGAGASGLAPPRVAAGAGAPKEGVEV